MESEQRAVLLAIRVSRTFRNEVKIVAAKCDTTMEAFVVKAVSDAIAQSRAEHQEAATS